MKFTHIKNIVIFISLKEDIVSMRFPGPLVFYYFERLELCSRVYDLLNNEQVHFV
ncbi:hypothetical protein SDC9_149321 [bioreactor metagenome]|uniref:Uncharacterized protein n=1 Tax=bioreactor metagenome TaxID=1076179 RepID=A0A645EJB4_9ZZZZ